MGYNTMRLIVTAGWSIYPLGYLFGYLLGQVDEKVLNVVYNVADFVNKIAFVLHAGLVPRLTLRARLRLCWGKRMLQQSPGFRRKKTELRGSLDQCPKNNLAEFWTASFTVLDDKAGVVSRVSSATGDTVHNCCASRDLHVKCERNDLHC